MGDSRLTNWRAGRDWGTRDLGITSKKVITQRAQRVKTIIFCFLSDLSPSRRLYEPEAVSLCENLVDSSFVLNPPYIICDLSAVSSAQAGLRQLFM